MSSHADRHRYLMDHLELVAIRTDESWPSFEDWIGRPFTAAGVSARLVPFGRLGKSRLSEADTCARPLLAGLVSHRKLEMKPKTPSASGQRRALQVSCTVEVSGV